MKKIYLKAGQEILITGYVRVGTSNTVLDTHVDWTKTIISQNDLTKSMDEIVVGIYTDKIIDDEYVYYKVYLDQSLGKLWYDGDQFGNTEWDNKDLDLEISIEELDLKSIVKIRLSNAGITNVSQLIDLSTREIMDKVPELDIESVDVITKAISNHLTAVHLLKGHK